MATLFAPSDVAPLSSPHPSRSVQTKPRQARIDLDEALERAAVAERASHDVRRNTRCRLSYLLCEVANHLRQANGGFNPDFELSRDALADAMNLSLYRVKRVLGLLSLSGVIAIDGPSLKVADWRRLCAMANVDPLRLGIALDADDEEDDLTGDLREITSTGAHLMTANGEPACFA